MEYYAVRRSDSEDELKHYGVLGMKWGIRRARNQLSKSTSGETRDRAVSSLSTHRSKATSKIGKLENKGTKLQKKVENNIIKSETKAAKLNMKAAKARKKMYGVFTSANKAEKLYFKANKLEARANDLIAKSKNYKAKVEANKTLITQFQRGIDEIDQILVDNGRRYING